MFLLFLLVCFCFSISVSQHSNRLQFRQKIRQALNALEDAEALLQSDETVLNGMFEADKIKKIMDCATVQIGSPIIDHDDVFCERVQDGRQCHPGLARLLAIRRQEHQTDESLVRLLAVMEVLVEWLKKYEIISYLSIVPTSAAAGNHSFFGQELEDQFVFQHFWNENTARCHQFGTRLFEAGAFKGIQWSNTLFFERHFGLKSTLVEPSPGNWPELDESGRNADIFHEALCEIGMKSVNVSGAGTAVDRVSRGGQGHQIPCHQFDSKARYSFFSLDVEGFEFEFLKNRSFSADIVLIEVNQWLMGRLSILFNVLGWFHRNSFVLYEAPVGARNLVFISQKLAQDCFSSSIHNVKTQK